MTALPAPKPEEKRRDYALPEEIALRAREDRDPASLRNVVLGRLTAALADNEPYESVSRHADPLYRFWALADAYLAPETVRDVLKQAMGKMLPLPASEFPADERPSEFSKSLADLDRAVTELAVSQHPNAPVSALELLAKEGANPSARHTADRRLKDQAFRAAWEEADRIAKIRPEDPDARMQADMLADLLLNEKFAHPGPACAVARSLSEKSARLAQAIELRGGDFGPRIVTEIVRRYPVAAAGIFRMVLTRFLDDAPIMAAIAGSPHLSDVLAEHLSQNPRTPTQALEALSENKNPQVRAWAKKALADRKENGNARTDRIQKAVRSVPADVKAAIQGTAAAMVLDMKAGAPRVDAGIAGAVARAGARTDDDWLEKAPAAEFDPELDGGGAADKEPSSVIDVQRMVEEAVAKKVETDRRARSAGKPAASVTEKDAACVAKTAQEAAKKDVGTEQITLRHDRAENDLEKNRAARELLDHQESKRITKSCALEPKTVSGRPDVGDASSAARAAEEEWPGLLAAGKTLADGGVKPEPLPENGAPGSEDRSVRIVKSEKIVREGAGVDNPKPGA